MVNARTDVSVLLLMINRGRQTSMGLAGLTRSKEGKKRRESKPYKYFIIYEMEMFGADKAMVRLVHITEPERRTKPGKPQHNIVSVFRFADGARHRRSDIH